MAKLHRTTISRRRFLTLGGAAVAGAGLVSCSRPATDSPTAVAPTVTPVEPPRIVRRRRLGRTGFEVSDISSGGAGNDANVFRYAYDLGVNYFDSAETYGNGEAERKLGEALQHMDRGKVFVTTKLVIEPEDTEATLLDRFGGCQERLRTEYVDALFQHSVQDVDLLGNEPFHAVVRRLKADGRLRFAGVSCHGAEDEDDDSMEQVLVAAAEDGRFDLMLIAYNFLKAEQGERVLAACAAHDVGTTGMKSAPASLDIEPYDPDNPTEEYADYIARAAERGTSREEAEERIRSWIEEQEETLVQAGPFIEQRGLTTDDELRIASIRWVLANPDMHTVCIGFRDFDEVEQAVRLSGTPAEQTARSGGAA